MESTHAAKRACEIDLSYFGRGGRMPPAHIRRKSGKVPSLVEEIERSIDQADICNEAERTLIKTHLFLLSDRMMWRYHANYAGYTYGEVRQLSTRLTPLLKSRMENLLDAYEKEVDTLVDAAITNNVIPIQDRELWRNIYLYKSPIHPDLIEYRACPVFTLT